MPTDHRPRLILGTHDLGVAEPANAEQRAYWMPLPALAELVDTLDAAAQRGNFTVELTSDDGFAADYQTLLPWLLATGRQASFFVPTGFVGREGHLNLSELRAIHAAGMPIGLHGVDHLNWPEAAAPALTREIVDGKQQLEDWLGAPVTLAAPPYGAYDRRVVSQLQAAGITTIYTCRGGYSTRRGLLQTRVIVRRGEPTTQLAALAARGPRPLDAVRPYYHALQLAVGR